jgi:glutamate 5-kinase
MGGRQDSPQLVVVKVGASILTDRTGRPDAGRMARIVEQVARLSKQRRQVVLVSSGAIACGMSRLGFTQRPKELGQLQACAAVGQGELMRRYAQAFGEDGLTVAQVLLTQGDIADRERCANVRHCMSALLEHGAVPIVNENDVVAVEEMTFGDNDRLAALVGCLVEAQLVVILSDVDGLLHNGRVIERIDRLDASHRAMVLGSSRETTTGGMAAKLAAAKIAQHGGIPLVIANGSKDGILDDILSGKPVGTLISPPNARLAFRKWWIAFSARQPVGAVVIDAGAAEALLRRKKSLLPSGVRDVRGRFHAGDPVTILDAQDEELGRGLSNFSSSELQRIRGLKSAQVVEVLGDGAAGEAIHRDNLVVTKDL